MKNIVLRYLLFICIPFSIHATTEPRAIDEKMKLCAACHGPKGISVNSAWPHLAGQHATYLIKQLQDYQQKHKRDSAVMSPLAMTLTEAEMREIADFYASQPAPKALPSKKYQQRGEQLYRGGDFSKHITACIACHGPNGTGNEQAGFPRLSGQHPAYTIQQMEAFKHHERRNDLNGIMQDISGHMDIDDMTAVAYYLQGLQTHP